MQCRENFINIYHGKHLFKNCHKNDNLDQSWTLIDFDAAS